MPLPLEPDSAGEYVRAKSGCNTFVLFTRPAQLDTCTWPPQWKRHFHSFALRRTLPLMTTSSHCSRAHTSGHHTSPPPPRQLLQCRCTCCSSSSDGGTGNINNNNNSRSHHRTIAITSVDTADSDNNANCTSDHSAIVSVALLARLRKL